jgi:gliding motility-associated-like protein
MVLAEADSSTINSLSNIVEFYANQPPIPQLSYISQVQVHSDTILVKYLGDNGIGIKSLNIYRSLDNGISFELISSELNPIFPFIYYDLEVYPSERSYLYQMSVTDSCLNEVAFSNYGQSIFLDVSSEDYLINNLVWNSYQNWENGIEKYEILTSNNLNPTFELLVEDTILNYLHDFTNFLEPLFDGRICYQISAIENQSSFGSSGISTSNIKCLQNEPIVFIPNALDLNGVVNYWKPIIKMIDFSDYRVSIYNRQGELIAFLENIDQVWDGKIMNSNNLAPMGVYVYQVEFKNPSGNYFHKKGQITLIR